MPTRRFDDTLPPLDPLEPIRDSSWDKLDEAGKAELLRRHYDTMLQRHQAIMDIQGMIRDRVVEQGAEVKANAEATRKLALKVDDEVQPLLIMNTAATARTEAKVDGLTKNTEALLKFWTEASGTANMVGRVASLGKSLMWFAIPLGACVTAWHAFQAWLKAGMPIPWLK